MRRHRGYDWVGPCKGWRLPTYDEMVYLFNSRAASTVYDSATSANVSNARFALCKIPALLLSRPTSYGICLIPDTFTLPSGVTMSRINTRGASGFDNNSWSNGRNSPWNKLSNAGCVFITATGTRDGLNYWYPNGPTPSDGFQYPWHGHYGFWSSSSSSDESTTACALVQGAQSGTGMMFSTSVPKHVGLGVFLIRENPNGRFSISATRKCDVFGVIHCMLDGSGGYEWKYSNGPGSAWTSQANLTTTYTAYDSTGRPTLMDNCPSVSGDITCFGFGTSGKLAGLSPYKNTSNVWIGGDIQPWDNSTVDTHYTPYSLVSSKSDNSSDTGYNMGFRDWGVGNIQEFQTNY